MNTEPTSEIHTEAEVVASMDAAASEVGAVLPDFPGFASRTRHEVPCGSGHAGFEISYRFAESSWSDPLVRETYTEALRAHWADSGYTVHRDDSVALASGRVDRNVEALREGGINLWYRVSGVVGLVVQSGCAPVR